MCVCLCVHMCVYIHIYISSDRVSSIKPYDLFAVVATDSFANTRSSCGTLVGRHFSGPLNSDVY